MNYFDFVMPTFIENWATPLCNLSIAQVDLPLGLVGTRKLQEAIEATWFALENGKECVANDFTDELTTRLDQAIQKFPDGAFIRLGSRSPKDSMLFHDTHGRVESGRQALNLLTHFSERVWEDLYQAIKHEYPAHIFVREWQEIEPWTEFRCFMKDRRLVGISQYDYFAGPMPEIAQHEGSIRFAIEHFFNKFRHVSHLDDVVFDVFLKQHRAPQNEQSWEVRLLEINPWGEWTDPCLFDHRNGGDFDESFRFVR